MEWYEDEAVWQALDDWILCMWNDFDILFTALRPYHNDFPLQTKAILFGGIGQFTATYVKMRNRGNDEITSYDLAMASVANNKLIEKLMSQVINTSIDNSVQNMKE